MPFAGASGGLVEGVTHLVVVVLERMVWRTRKGDNTMMLVRPDS
jgi:hypothetical protein